MGLIDRGQAAAGDVHARVTEAFRQEYARVVASVLRMVRDIDGVDAAALRGYHLLPAARADFLRRLGRWAEAVAEYRRALALTDNVREQRFYSARLAACEAGGEGWIPAR